MDYDYGRRYGRGEDFEEPSRAWEEERFGRRGDYGGWFTQQRRSGYGEPYYRYGREGYGEPTWRGREFGGERPYGEPTWRGRQFGEERPYGEQGWRGREFAGERGAGEPGWRGTEYGLGERYETFGEGWTTPGPYTGRGPRGYQRSDERIREDVNERLTQHGQIDATDIDVRVDNGVATLSGTANSRREKRMAEDVAESVSGVKDIDNQLKVQERQGLGERISEALTP